MIKNYKTQLKQINAYFNKKAKEIRKAERLFRESAAVNKALAGSHSLRRFLIENKIECYGVGSCYGLKYLDISGKGMSELLRIFKDRKKWTISEMHGSQFDGYEIKYLG